MNARKILIATAPFDGHFNPLTSIAVHLKNQGFDVRWYTSRTYEPKVKKLGIPFYSFINALEVNQNNLNEVFPERSTINSAIGKIKFDIKHVFVKASEKYFEDIRQIHDLFPFDLLIIDPGLTGGQLVKEKLGKPVISIGVMPLMETSRDLYPSGLGLTPKKGFFGRMHQGIMRFMSKNVIFKNSTDEYNRILTAYGLKPVNMNIFDVAVKKSDLYLQIGSPGFEYFRSDLSENVRFIGKLLPHSTSHPRPFAHFEKLERYDKIILVSQGTVDNKDPEKLMIPTIEAFKDTPFLVIVATGNLHTEALRKRYPQENIIIEDFVDYNYIMPYTDVFVTCGGYGSVMLSISHNVPMVAAGIHEGKNEITSRIGYFNLGVNLKTDQPSPEQIENGVKEVLTNRIYTQQVGHLREELNKYNTLALCEKYVNWIIKEENEVMTFPGVALRKTVRTPQPA